MDSDEFDDDIPDEVLLMADSLAQSQKSSAFPDHRPQIHHRTQALQAPQAPAGSYSSSSRQAAFGNLPSQPSGVEIIDLDDLPSDAFSSSPHGASSAPFTSLGARQPLRAGGPVPNYRQTTLFGQTVAGSAPGGLSQRVNSNRAFRVDLPEEKPTHHEIDREAMETWVYPTNLGAIRDYQYTIVSEGLFKNTLVALPTGLGKTFIAATIMLNFFRWTKTAKIIFVAPTKPLVSQQVDACFNIVGIPRSETTLLTGEVSPGLRAEEWATKRVFFMTPQTLENDLSSGIADPKSIALLVVDEAHRATGNYSYVKVIKFIRRFSSSFRVLALTATPGSTVEGVQEVIDGLGISHIEIRTENSLDIRQYVHQRQEDVEILDPSEEMEHVKELFTKALKPLVDKLSKQNIYYGRDPMSLTNYGLIQASKEWFAHAGRHAPTGVQHMMRAVFSVLTSLAHSIKLLNFHGIKPFYDNIVHFRDETEGKGQKGSKNKRQVIDSPDFQEMMTTISRWVRKDDFVSHPKLIYLSETILNHFMDNGGGQEGAESSNTRIIVFSEYRDSAEEIVRVLNHHRPMVRAAVFVGQADTKQSGGMKQSEQIERIKNFKEGVFNVLVATSIGEEGLDIGQVDLIVCYDSSASPIRMLQRMGRTGRKRAGRVVLLLMRGKEQEKYDRSRDNYDKMQKTICEGSRFAFRHDLSTRIVPRDIKPRVDKTNVEIPIENTQNNSLPEPRKGAARKKRAPKKFNMPDDVETGFVSVASMLGKKPAKRPANTAAKAPASRKEEDEVVDVPNLARVYLTSQQDLELQRVYQNLPYHQHKVMEIDSADLKANPAAQRKLRKTVQLKHGEHTKRCVKLFKALSKSQETSEPYDMPYGGMDQSLYDQIPVPNLVSDSEEEAVQVAAPARKKRKTASFSDDNQAEAAARPRKPQPKTGRPERPNAPKRAPKVSSRKTNTGGVGDDQDEETSIPRPPAKGNPSKPKAARKEPAQAKRGRPSKKQQSLPYDESADEGDDCRRTSDLELTEDSDDGSDLADFVVGDNVATSSAPPTSSMRRRSTSPTTPLVSSAGHGMRWRQRFSYESSQLTATQASEDELPSMSQLAGKRTQASVISDVETEDEDEDEAVVQRAGRGGKRRLVIDDDDSDDY